MASVNKVILVGNIGRDPETRAFPDGTAVTNVTVATTDRWRDKQTGENREATEWHRISFSGRLAEIAAEYLRKGSQVYVEGSLRTRKWSDRDGIERYTTEIRADTMQMLGSRQQGDDMPERRPPPAPATNSAGPGRQRNEYEAAKNGARSAPPPPRAASGFDDMDDDIPF